jgi:mRNA interferase RelE/StbE
LRARVAEKISALGTDPRPQGVKKLAHTERTYRVRVGDYRIVYEIADAERVVSISKIGHRRDVYR